MAIKVNGIKKITNLTAASTINDADVFMIETTSGSRKVTGATLKTLINNLAQTKADAVGDAAAALIADEFDASNSYETGDYVMSDGKLYKFTSPHETGAFDGTDAVEVVLSDEMVSDVTVNGTSVVSNGVAEIPMAVTPNDNNTHIGLVKLKYNRGLSIDSDGILNVNGASNAQIKTGSSTTAFLSASSASSTAFYGLAKAAGDTTQSASSNTVGTYTDEAKAAIKTMLGVNDGIEVVRLV